MSLSVLIASGGRPSLGHAIESVTAQLDLDDEILLLVDQLSPKGHSSRNRMMRWAKNTHLAFLDDDDEWLPDAGERIRAAIRETPKAAHIFGADHRELTKVRRQELVVPNAQSLGIWAESSLHPFVLVSCRFRPVVWHDEAITRG